MVEIYCDGADLSKLEEYAEDERIKGFTTNPSLMKKAGIKDYKTFAKTVLSLVKGKPVSFEVLSDDWKEMERQAREIQSWGDNVYVKIPITNTKGESSKGLIEKIADLNLNITAIMTWEQTRHIELVTRSNHILSVFNGRIMDTLRHPIIFRGSACLRSRTLWASTRELFNIYQAEFLGYDIITLTPDLIEKFPLQGKDLTQYSRETVQQFHKDGEGLTI